MLIPQKNHHSVTEHPIPLHRDRDKIRYHFSSVRKNSLLCPFRHEYKEKGCPFAMHISEPYRAECVFAHKIEDLTPNGSIRKEEFNPNDWKHPIPYD